MNNIKVLTRPEPDDPEILRPLQDWINARYDMEIEQACKLMGERVTLLRPLPGPTPGTALANAGHEGIVCEAVFCTWEEEHPIRYRLKLTFSGNIVGELAATEFRVVPGLMPAPEIKPLPETHRDFVPPWLPQPRDRPDEAFNKKRVRIIDAERFPGKYLSDGVVTQTFVGSSYGHTFVVKLDSGEVLKDVRKGEVRFL